MKKHTTPPTEVLKKYLNEETYGLLMKGRQSVLSALDDKSRDQQIVEDDILIESRQHNELATMLERVVERAEESIEAYS